MELIDKEKVVAEIERLKECNRKICAGDFDFLKKTYPEHYYSTEIYNGLLSFLNTLEVKEVDLEKEFYDFLDTLIGKDNGHLSEDELFRIAEYFFGLGINAKKGE